MTALPVKMHGPVATKMIGALTFQDISAEEYRVYTFANGETVRVDKPLWLNVSVSGGHRIVVSDNSTVYIPGKYLKIQWFNKAGFDPVQF